MGRQLYNSLKVRLSHTTTIDKGKIMFSPPFQGVWSGPHMGIRQTQHSYPANAFKPTVVG